MRGWQRAILLIGAILVGLGVDVRAGAVPTVREHRLHPRDVSEAPSFVQHIEASLVGLRVQIPEGRPSAATLGTRRFATAVVFDPRGYAVTVSYVLLDAGSVEGQTRDGRTVSGRVVGVDFDSGLGVVKLDGPGPWRAATLADSRDVTVGAMTATVGVDDDNDLVQVAGSVQTVRRFSAYWEYMLDRAFIIAPSSPSWGGSAVVDTRGHVIGIASLRLGEPPHVNLAIPMEKFVPVKDELINLGRVVSRPARPWLGVYTLPAQGGVVIDGVSPVGPAGPAGLRKGDRILRVNGDDVRGQEEFYETLWRARAGDVVTITVVRNGAVHPIPVRSIDRRELFRTTTQ